MIGAILNIASGAVSLFNKIADALRDKKLRQEGADSQKLSDATKVLADVQAANSGADSPDVLEFVRRKNAAGGGQ